LIINFLIVRIAAFITHPEFFAFAVEFQGGDFFAYNLRFSLAINFRQLT
jgi:hypothetical protein